jgi:hypothetical protein
MKHLIASVLLLTLCLWSTNPHAQPRLGRKPTPSLAALRPLESSMMSAKHLKGLRVLRQGKFSKFAKMKIRLADGVTKKLGDITKGLFKAQRGYMKQLRGMGAVAEEHAIETKDFVMVARATTVMVKDPKSMGRRWKVYGQMLADQPKVTASSMQVAKYRAKLTAAERKEFDDGIAALKKRLKTAAKDHPLKQAMDKDGDSGLLAAIISGQGEVTVEDSIMIPKKAPYWKNNRLMAPTMTPTGFNLGRMKATKKFKRPRWRDAWSGYKEGGAPDLRSIKFMTGWSKEQSWEWKRTLHFPSGYFQIRAGAYYSVGFRVPVEMRARVTPSSMSARKGPKLRGGKDKNSKFKVYLSADVGDRGKRYYTKVGLGGRAAGKEIKLMFGAHLSCRFRALYRLWLSETGSGRPGKCHVGKDVDFSFEMKPVYGKRDTLYFKPPKDFAAPLQKLGIVAKRRGRHKGWYEAAIFVPPDLLGTRIGIPGGSVWAAPGLKFGGDGRVVVDYESREWTCRGRKNCAYKKRKTGRVTKKETLTFRGKGRQRFKGRKYEHVVQTKIGALKNTGRKNFGFRLSKPQYHWTIKITPGLRVGGYVKVEALVKTFRRRLGPWDIWFDGLALNLGTIKLPTHKGTPKEFVWDQGRKSFSEKSSSEGICVLAGTPVAMADGSQRAIETIRIGDRVLSFDTETRKLVTTTVTRTFVHSQTEQIIMLNNGLLGATDYHRIFSDGAWKRADALRAGDPLLTLGADANGGQLVLQTHTVSRATPQSAGGVPSYNLAIDGPGNFFAAGVLVESE